MDPTEMLIKKSQIKPWKINDWMRNKLRQKCWAVQKGIRKVKLLWYIVWATQMPNSNTNNMLVLRLRTTGLLHANTNTEESQFCYHKSLIQLKGT